MLKFFTRFFNKNLGDSQRYTAFTLAEVLITLGILGILAEMTIPTLINDYKKNVVVTSVKSFYSNMSQAIKLSEIENGPTNSWDYGDGTAAGTHTWFDTYLAKYLSYSKSEEVENDNFCIYLNNGYKVLFYKGTAMDIVLFLEPSKSGSYGKNKFRFLINTTDKTNAFRPYDRPYEALHPRGDYLIGEHACTTTGSKVYCAMLMMVDGWQIKDDYPW